MRGEQLSIASGAEFLRITRSNPGIHVKIDDAKFVILEPLEKLFRAICEGSCCKLHLEPDFCGLLVPIWESCEDR
jgi:hypothetical protein